MRQGLTWSVVLATAMVLSGCKESNRPKPPDPTKGTVRGVVVCADTDKPARFAQVMLLPIPAGLRGEGEVHLDEPRETTQSGLDGSFELEAVEPGRYYAIAQQTGYFDPERAINFASLEAKNGDERRQAAELLEQLNGQLVEVTVRAGRESAVRLTVHRAGEIEGTVRFEDGSPAIGVRFRAMRRGVDKEWSPVGFSLFGSWKLTVESDSHGRYNLSSLPAGEYAVCAAMPIGTEEAAPQLCMGNVFRRSKATVIKLGEGEIATGNDLTIPLDGLHAVAGKVTAVHDGHAVGQGVVRLLYADDREEARQTKLETDGSFRFEYVPVGRYVVAVSEAKELANDDEARKSGGSYADREFAVAVQDETTSLNLGLVAVRGDSGGSAAARR